MKEGKLDREEKDLLGSFERGEWVRVKGFADESARIRQAAGKTLRKDCRVNIRIASRDLNGLRSRAAEEGIPYQTLIASILHKYVSGNMVAH